MENGAIVYSVAASRNNSAAFFLSPNIAAQAAKGGIEKPGERTLPGTLGDDARCIRSPSSYSHVLLYKELGTGGS